MIRLLQIELRKALRFKAIWWLSLLYFGVMAALLFGIEAFINEVVSDAGSNLPITIPGVSLYSFPGIWHNLAYLSSFLKIFMAIIGIILVTNEYNYKTIKQQVLHGLTRAEMFWAKVLLNMTIALFATFVLATISTILGISHTETITWANFTKKLSFLLAYFYEVFAYISMGFMIATLVHRSGFAIGILMLYAFIIDPIADYKLPDGWGDFLPAHAIGQVIQIPNSQLMRLFGIEFQEYVAMRDILISGMWILIFHGIVFWYYKKKDL